MVALHVKYIYVTKIKSVDACCVQYQGIAAKLIYLHLFSFIELIFCLFLLLHNPHPCEASTIVTFSCSRNVEVAFF